MIIDKQGIYNPIIDEVVLNSLKKSSYPCVLWGAGEVAEKVYAMLHNGNKHIDAVWVDGKTDGIFHDVKIKDINTIQSEYSQFDLVFGHNRYDKIKSIKKDYPQIRDVFYFYSTFGWDENFDYDYFNEHQAEIQMVCDFSEDELSIKSYEEYLNSRVNKNPLYITDECIEENYFNNDILKLSDNETLLEIGACKGNIVKLFSEEVNDRYSKIIAIEPDIDNFIQLKKNVEKKFQNIELINLGCWSHKTNLSFIQEGTGRSNHIDVSETSTITIPVDSIDNMVDDRISVVNLFVQTGIEEMLMGAEKTIKRYRPKLVVGIGLRKEQCYLVPKLIKELNEDYKIYYRFLGGVPSRFTLFAV